MPDDGVPGLPFFNQDIPKLQGVPDFTDRSHMWADYTKDGYCVRSIVGFNPNDFEFVVNFFQDILRSGQLRGDARVAGDEGNIDYAGIPFSEADRIDSQLSDGIQKWDMERIKDIIGNQEEIMDECYKQFKVIVETRDNIVFSRLPFRYIYSLYRCLMYNALLSTMGNALSVERMLAQPVARVNGRRVESNVGSAKGTFGQTIFMRALFNNIKVHRGLAPEPQEIWRRYFSYVVLNQDKTKRHMRYKHPNLSITPQNLSVAENEGLVAGPDELDDMCD